MRILTVIFTLLISTIFIGCNQEDVTSPNTSIFEKRTPIKKDTVKKRVPIERALGCLGLSREQHIAIMEIVNEGKKCEIECKKEFQESVQILREDYKSKMEKYRNVKKTDEIKKEIEIITFEYRQTLRDLEREHREKMAECAKNTHTDIETLLRKDQLTLWNIWKATGKIPCDRVKP
jgi:hypothetical protein